MNYPPIIVTGGPRSGTTLTMRYLREIGMVVGEGAERNPLVEGQIRDRFYKPVLKRGGFDPLAQDPLPPPGWDPGIDPTGEATRQEICAQFQWPEKDGEFGSKPWGFKAIKGLLFWPVIQRAFPEAKWVIIERKPREHAESLHRTPFMRAYDSPEGWQKYMLKIQAHMLNLRHSNQVHCMTFWPAAFREQSWVEILQLLNFTGLYREDWKDAVERVFDKSKYKVAS